jgi:simple sugar transport system ATP-binding protein
MPAAGPGGVPRLALSGIRKVYPSVVANDGIDLAVRPGEIHAVLGENGAGKSTLMKVIYGVVKPDAGEIRWEGRPVEIPNPHAARALGLGMVFQHFSLFDTLTAAQNVWLGLDSALPLAAVARSIRAKAAEYGVEVDPERPVHTLSVGERQRVEIVRALLGEPQLLILDEPTSVLTPQAVEKLFATLRLLAGRGCSILYISHKLDEIRALCHACTVLRGGRVTGVVDPRTVTSAELSRLMIGAEPPRLEHRRIERGAIALQARGLALARRDEFGVTLEAIDLDVHSGEVVGIAGVSGNGQQELLAALSGEDRRAAPGTIRLFGDDVARESPGRRRRRGLHYVPEERLGRGAVPTLGLAHNVLLTRREPVRRGGWLDLRRMTAMTERIIERFKVKAGGPGAAARSLSGGNLQKYIVGREIDARPRVIIVAQPTWGVDVGASAQIRAELLGLRDAGCAVLAVSEELDELFEIADRLYVIARGRMSPPIATAAATPERIGQWMSGLWEEGTARAAA